MNQVFNIHRFALTLRLEIAEKGRNYLLMATVMAFAMTVLMVPVTLSREFSGFREVLHYFALLLILLFGGSLFTSGTLAQYSAPATGISALMVPASPTEKFMTSLLFNLAFLVPLLCFYWWLHFYTLEVANEKIINQASKYHPMTADIVNYTSFSFFGIQACVFLGSIFFRKNAYIKTAVIAISIAFLVSIANTMIAIRFTENPTKVTALPLSGWKLWYYNEDGGTKWRFASIYYYLPLSDNLLLMAQLVAGALVILLWICAFYQLKEREI
ncbi:hypothetical protein SAMN04487996_122112 [Dyadobacter soli]|uniref:ABC-2 type transport system permease protein n=1 Tax=Dyadobacter soli TaxID=659014 RepID=A0A1G7WN24_9BACT|nr:hypothetical protein [Dyadobacter soli]SDG73407.1 hypothetical protein SAMN04487996_122112 [Dyadobacter soli]